MIAAPATDLWTFRSDLAERRRLFASESFSHPAKLHLGFLRRLVETYTDYDDVLLDPMAGSGSLLLAAYIMRDVVLRDLQPEYVDLMRKSEIVLRGQAGMFCGCIDIGQADARTLTLDRVSCSHILCSPPYAFETGKGITPERLARMQTMGTSWRNKVNGQTGSCWTGGMRYEGGQNNAGNKSGRNYWRDMTAIYQRCADLLPPGGHLILVLKDHYRRGRRICICDQTVEVVEGLGMGVKLLARHGRFIDRPSIWQRRRKEAGLPIVDVEEALVFRKGGSA